MPRPHKKRRVGAMPGCGRFGPKGSGKTVQPPVVMTVDEFETIRLIDLEAMTQEECANQMHVARTTAQAIYGSARTKLAQCLVHQRELMIEGGNYVLYDDSKVGCKDEQPCKRHRRHHHGQSQPDCEQNDCDDKTNSKD